uniref:Uncharacterized protein n=1 Tax=Anguilla anguilla TaxID=7936 RepID=A0A0E9U0Q1_ANGAN
MLVMEISCC